MKSEEIRDKLDELMILPAETECVEFKEAKNDYDFDDLGKYFSALSNEANLKGKAAGWLIFGITDRVPRQICGSNYRLQQPGLERLKGSIAKNTNHQITFMDIYELNDAKGRVVLFKIPPAPRGIPTAWKGIAYGRIRESLSPLSIQEIEQIDGQSGLYRNSPPNLNPREDLVRRLVRVSQRSSTL